MRFWVERNFPSESFFTRLDVLTNLLDIEAKRMNVFRHIFFDFVKSLKLRIMIWLISKEKLI